MVLPVGFVGEAELPPPPPPHETGTSEANRNAIINLLILNKILHLQQQYYLFVRSHIL